ncbi:MAG: low molecular weight phosphotyrosine protein phosphatase [Rhodothermales bacterium]|nr:low molecular weight phosphotyrosine protein phosphatase [Rhodothermales bacterium]
MNDRIRVLFVCLGNICRSPLAEGVFRELLSERGLEDRFDVDSAGTGSWHVGDAPDRRMRRLAVEKGISIDDLRARQFNSDDLDAFDHVLAMDKNNLHDILFLDRDESSGHKVRLFREFDPEPGDFQVPDPYYGGEDGFENVYRIVRRTAESLLDRLVEEHELKTA